MNPLLKALNAHLQEQTELTNLAAELLSLEARKVEVESRIRELLGDSKINQFETASAVEQSSDPGRELSDVLFKILSQYAPMTAVQVVEAAVTMGCGVRSDDFEKNVRRILSNDSRFQKVSKPGKRPRLFATILDDESDIGDDVFDRHEEEDE